MTSSIPPGFEIVQLSGPELITYLAEWSLFSTLTVQLYLYYQAFPNDRLFAKCLVYIVYAIHLVEIILVTLDAFKTFGYGFGDISALASFGVSSIWSDIVPALVSFIVQSFYAFRLYLLCKSWIIPILIVTLSLAVSAFGFTTVAFVLEAGNVSLLGTKRISIFGGVWLGGSALIDILIAISMTYYLTTRDTGFRRTKVLVLKFVRLTIETGALTALVALTTLILFFTFPNKSYYTTLANIMPFIYANTMLVVLNSRFQIVGGRSTPPTSLNFASWPALPSGDLTMISGATSTQTQTREVFSNGEMDTDSSIEMKAIHRGSGDHTVYAV
ncbi:hypothetical protein MVEN_01421500 [Mycena venus]|uniref:DUF6534 domain-containing protein n=1 Tax=Mycena venus TaxID=2733690 RepID=A0A8H6XYB8_9AGAR|nr:hypothetical protein MVEN_01421500 [Mycena venus]